MTFCEALEKMKKGMSVCRREWDGTDKILWLDGAIFMVEQNGRRFPIVFFSHEILATDWEIV